MKQKIFARMGMWLTPPCIRKSKTSLKALTLLLVMVASVNVWGATETIDIIATIGTSSSVTLNGTSTKVNDYISINGAKNDATNAPVINNGADLRFYKYASGKTPSTVTISATKNATITKIEFLKDATTKSILTSISASPGALSDNVWTGSASDVTLTYANTSSTFSKQIYIINVTYTYEGAAKTLESIAVSGTPTKTTYEADEEFDPAGLTVTGTYSDNSHAEITSGIDWSSTPNPLTAGTTSVSVTAKVGDIPSAPYQVNGLTVTAALPKITITADKIANFEGSYKEYTWTANDVTGKCWAYKSGDLMQFNNTPYIYNTVAVPGYIKSIEIVKGGGTDRTWSVYCSTTALTSTDGGTQIGSSQTVGTSGYTWDVDTKEKYTYFYITKGSNSTQISKIVITYEEDKTPSIEADVEAIAFAQKELDGTVTDSKTISATGKNLTAAISAEMKSGSDAIFSVTPVGTPTATAGKFTVSYSTTEAKDEYKGWVVLSSGETSIEIPVSASVVAHIPVLQSISVSGTPDKTEYTVGDAFETAGLVVTGTYDVGEPQPITEGIEWEVTPATFSATTETSVSVVAKALEKTSEAFTVNGLIVNEAPKFATFSGDAGADVTFATGSSSADGAIWAGSPCAKGIITLTGNVTSGNNYSYYDGSVVRFYTNNNLVLTPANGYKITKVEIVRQSTTSSNSGTIECKVLTADENNTTTNTNIFTGSTKGAVTFTADAQARFKSITVTYEEAAPAAATPTITPSAEAETYFDAITVTLATTTDGAAIYYTTNGDAPTTVSTLYENPIAVSATTTIKAIAVKEGLDNSEVATKEFKFGPVYANLVDLVNAGEPTTTGKTVKVTLTNEEIAAFDGTQGIYIDVPTDPVKRIEVYCKNCPNTWVIGGTVSGTLQCTWKKYSNGTWELCPTSWNELTYNAPAGTTEVVLTDTPTKNVYIDGEKFDPAGITVTATINGVPTVVTEGITWSVETLTLGTTSIDITAIYNNVVSNTIENFAVAVNPIQESTIADFIANEGGRCYLVGEITSSISNGSFTLTDESGSIYVYKHTLDGVASIAQGDYIKVIAEEYEYYDGKTHEAKNVVVIEKPTVAVTGVSLDKEVADVQQGQSLTLVATITPARASNKNLTWSIINDNTNGKISVDQEGKVSVAEDAEVDATATVQVKTEDGNFTDECVITVKEYKAVKFGRYYGELTDGDYVITAIYQENEGALNNTISSKRLGITKVTPSEDYIIDPEATIIWHIAADGDYWTISNVNGYAASTGTKSEVQLQAVADKDSKANWDITAQEDDVYDIESVYNRSLSTPVNSWLRRNQNTGWACYAKSTGSSVKLYKKDFKAKAVLSSIAISGDLTKKDYFVDQKILPAGLTVTGTYSDGNHETITEGITWSINPESFSETTTDGSVQITATVEGITSSPITINNIVVTEKPNVHTYGYFDFTTNGPDIDFSTGWSSSYAEHVVTADEATVTFASASKQNAGMTIDNMPVSKGDDVILHLTEADKQIASVSLTTEQWGTNTHTITIEVSHDGTSYTELAGVSGDQTNGIQANITNNAITYVKFKFSGTKQIGIESLTFTTADIQYDYVRTDLVVGNYGTVCLPYDVKVANTLGATFYEADYKDESVHQMYFNEVPEDGTLNAGQAYLFYSTASTVYAVYEPGTEVTEPVSGEDARGFYGVFERKECPSDRAWYGIYGTKIQPMAAGAGVPANRAYIKLDEVPTETYVEAGAPAPRRLAMVVPKSTATDLYLIDHKEGVRKMMMRTQIIIIREGRHYNVHGQMLK